jgi:hypothetical protein
MVFSPVKDLHQNGLEPIPVSLIAAPGHIPELEQARFKAIF